MNRGLAALVLSAAWGCEEPMVQPPPGVSIVAPVADALVPAGELVVRIEVQSLWMDGNETARRPAPSWSLIPTAHAYEFGLGFARVRLDGVPVGDIHSQAEHALTIPAVPAGHHVVEVELLGSDGYGGSPLDPPVTDSVAFTAE